MFAAGRLAAGSAALATLAAALVVAPHARATPPGSNGLIFFTSERNGQQEIYRMKPDGTRVQRLTTNPASDRNPEPSPDGLRIAFESNRSGRFEIWVMDRDGTDPVQVTFGIGSASSLHPAWSPDGSTIAFASNRTGNYEIYTIDAPPLDASDAPAQESGTRGITVHAAQDTGPAFSITGNQIGFTSDRSGNFDVFLASVGDLSVQQATFSGNTDFGPNFAPDGIHLGFSSNRTGTYQIHQSVLSGNMVDADAEAVNLSNRTRPGSEIFYAPDGTAVLLEGQAGNGVFQVFLVRPATGAITQLTSGTTRNGDPAMATRVPACRDREDNDNDGFTDFDIDPGCESSEDGSEGPDPQCGDRIDNDGDGRIDFDGGIGDGGKPRPGNADPACDSFRDPSEGVVRRVSRSIENFRLSDTTFRGRVASELPRCRSDEVFLRRSTSSLGTNAEHLAFDQTDDEGRFVIRPATNTFRQTRYYQARVVRLGFHSEDGETYTICSGALSEWLLVVDR